MSQETSWQRLYENYLEAEALAAYWSKKKSKLRAQIERQHEVTEIGSHTPLRGGPRSTLSYKTQAHVKKENMRDFILWAKNQPEFCDLLEPTLTKKEVSDIIEKCKSEGIEYPDYVSDVETVKLSVYKEGWSLSADKLPADYNEVLSK